MYNKPTLTWTSWGKRYVFTKSQRVLSTHSNGNLLYFGQPVYIYLQVTDFMVKVGSFITYKLELCLCSGAPNGP